MNKLLILIPAFFLAAGTWGAEVSRAEKVLNQKLKMLIKLLSPEKVGVLDLQRIKISVKNQLRSSLLAIR